MQHILILGLGNIILSDEGLGVRAVERLRERYRLPEHVQSLDGGTLGMLLLTYLDGVTDLLILDALAADAPPGTMLRLEGDDIQRALALKMSMHQLGLQEVLAIGTLQGNLPQRIVLWGMTPASIATGLELTPQIAAHLDTLVDAAADELRAWGVQLEPYIQVAR